MAAAAAAAVVAQIDRDDDTGAKVLASNEKLEHRMSALEVSLDLMGTQLADVLAMVQKVGWGRARLGARGLREGRGWEECGGREGRRGGGTPRIQ